MKRIYNNNEPDDFFDKDFLENMENINDNDEDDFDEDDFDDFEKFTTYIDIDGLKNIFSSQIEEIINKDTNLLLAVNLAQKKLFWRFYPERLQMEAIQRIFNKLEEIRNSSKKNHEAPSDSTESSSS